MIAYLFAILGVFVVTLVCHAWLLERRARRDRAKFRHITGSMPWWGRR